MVAVVEDLVEVWGEGGRLWKLGEQREAEGE